MNTFKLVQVGNTVTLKMLSGGEVAAASFSIKHGTNFTFNDIVLTNAPDGTVVNTNTKTPGEMGVLFDGVKPYAKSRKYVDIATLTFTGKGKTALEFADKPTRRSVASIDGRLLDAKWVNGKINIK